MISRIQLDSSLILLLPSVQMDSTLILPDSQGIYGVLQFTSSLPLPWILISSLVCLVLWQGSRWFPCVCQVEMALPEARS